MVALAAPTISTDASGDMVLGSGQLIGHRDRQRARQPACGRVDRLPPVRQRDVHRNAGLRGRSTCPIRSPAGPSPRSRSRRRTRGPTTGSPPTAATRTTCPCPAPAHDANETTVVARATPTITTNASSTISVGGQLTDNATVNGRVNPVEGGSITFRLYGPNNATCSGSPVFTSTPVPYPAAGGSVVSPPYTPTEPGDYRWIATYSGDANNTRGRGRVQRRQRADDGQRAADAAAAGRRAAAAAAAARGAGAAGVRRCRAARPRSAARPAARERRSTSSSAAARSSA